MKRKKPFLLLIINLTALIGLLFLFNRGIHLNTDLLSLLPQQSSSQLIESASTKFSERLSRQMVFLIGNQDKVKAQQATIQFTKQLQQSDLFQPISSQLTTTEQAAWGKLYYPYRLSLLTEATHEALANNKINQIQTNALTTLYNPAGFVNEKLLQNDPYFLFQQYLFSLPKPASNLTIDQGMLMTQSDNRWYAVLNITLKQDAYSSTNQSVVMNVILKAKNQLLAHFPNTQILMNGMLFYANAGATEAQKDISIIGIGSLIGILLLIFITFRSFQPFLLTIISAASGLLVGFVLTDFVFGSIYLFTLVFGMSLIGIAVDYAFFFFANQLSGGKTWSAEEGLNAIFPGISLALIIVIIAYIIIAIAPFPALRQLALFSIVGLTTAYLNVIALFPLFTKPTKRKSQPWIAIITQRYLHFCKTISRTKMGLLFLIVLILIIFGLYQLRANDDIHLLESIPANLSHQQNQIQKLIGSHLGMNYLIVTGKTAEETLEHEHRVAQTIDHAFPTIQNRYLAISSYLPTITRQKDDFQLTKTKLINKQLISYLEKMGVLTQPAKTIERHLAEIKFQPLTLQTWQRSPASKTLSFLWLGKINEQYATVLLLSDKLNTQTIAAIAQQNPNATYVNKANELSTIFKLYRERISALLLLAFFAIFALMSVRYGIKKSWKYFLPPATACLLSAAILGWLDIPLTLFNLLALVLVTSLAIDDVLFFAETKKSDESTMLAVALSAIISSLSFGLLMVSSTPVIHTFGLTTFIGIWTSFLLSPFSRR